MRPQLVDDRYVYQGPDLGWLDIATGEVVANRNDDGRYTRVPLPALVATIDQILRAADRRDAAGTTAIRLALPDVPLGAVLDEAARALHPLGFVAVRAGAKLPEPVRRDLLHRHVVLFALDGERDRADADAAAAWLRELTAASPRAHLLVLLKPASQDRPAARVLLAVRERAPTWPECWRSERPARAAEEVRAMIVRGDLQRAEASIHAAIAGSAARGERPDDDLRVCRAELCFWQGHFEEAAAALIGISSAPTGLMWSRLIAWARGASAPPNLCGTQPVEYLRAPLAAEAQLASGDAGRALEMLGARAARPARVSPLEAAVLGRIETACLAARGASRRRTGTPPISDAAAWRGFVRKTGARGVLRFGLGRDAMNLLQSVSALLEVVQDADDEFTALRHGCSWVREQASAEAAGIVASDGARLIVGEGVAASDLDDPDLRASLAPGRGVTIANGPSATVTAPMKYAGATIGFAIVRGRRDAAEWLGGAAAALASVCAPALRARLDNLSLRAASQTLVPEILGRSGAITGLREAIARAAGTAFPVLIEGESGTGKELVARAVHRLSARRDRRFTALNCAALTDDLVEAELFGYTRGAFTGAINHRAGLFEESHGSTLFLDEVTELSPRAQAKLLRVLQEREVRRVGEHVPRPVDVRVVAATNMPTAEAVGAGRFRADLLFRLAVVRLKVPPLRDRIEDVPLLAQAFWRATAADAGKRALLAPDAVAALCRHAWPGNVRELQNVIAALIVAASSRGRVGARHVLHVLVGQQDAAIGPASTLEEARKAFERRMIAAALARHGGRCARASRELGLSRQGLVKAMKRLGVESERRRRRVAVV